MRGTFSNYKMIECMRDHQTNWKKKIIKSFVALYSSKNGNFRMTIQFFNFCAFYLSQKLMWSVMLLMLLASLYILLEVHFHIYYKCCLIIFLLRSTEMTRVSVSVVMITRGKNIFENKAFSQVVTPSSSQR